MRYTLRWLIRSLCLLALAAVIAAWVTSYFAGLDLDKVKASRHMKVGIVQGYGYAAGGDSYPFSDSPLELIIIRWAKAKDWLPEPTTLGFYEGPTVDLVPEYEIIFPLWLPTLVLLGLNAFIWRKVFRRTPRGAFPIEPTAVA